LADNKDNPAQPPDSAASSSATPAPPAATPPPGDKPAAAAKPPAAKPAAKPAVPKPPAVMESTPWNSELTEALKARFGDRISEFLTYRDQNFLVCRPDSAIEILEHLKTDAGYDYLVDLTAVHWPKRAGEEFDLIYILYSFSRNDRVRVKARIADGYKPASAVPVHLTANWLERECFDMFGIEFAGHPDLRRILMPDEWTGHPLRKDYSIITMDQQWVQSNLGIESAQS
jgi:NADH-quinone oxidoreductase subunit C